MKKYFIHRNNSKRPDFRNATNEAIDSYVNLNSVEAADVKAYPNGNIIMRNDLEEIVFFGNSSNATISIISK